MNERTIETTSRLASCALLIAFLTASLTTRLADACSCEQPKPPLEELERVDAVFHGRVTEIRQTDEFELRVALDFFAVWKGVETETIEISTATDSAACGYHFSEGTDYIVYAWQFGDSLNANLCTRTRPHDEKEADELGEPILVFGNEVVPFVRGDANDDRNSDLSDAIVVLTYLFSFNSPLPCPKSADFNSDDQINLSDPIYLVNFFFLGGEVVGAPYPECGLDTEDASPTLPCESFTYCEV